MNDDKRTFNMRDKVKASTNHSRMESLSLNSEVKYKIKELIEYKKDTI